MNNHDIHLAIALAKEGASISLTLLAIRLRLKTVTIEEHYQLNMRIDRYRRLKEVLVL